MLSAWASGGESSSDILLNLEVLLIHEIPISRLPIQVSGDIRLLSPWISEVLERTLLVTSQGGSKDVVTGIPNIVFHSEPSIILEHVAIPPRAITLIVESGGIFSWARAITLCNVTVILL